MERRAYPQYRRWEMKSAPLQSLGDKELSELKEFIVARLRKELPGFLPESCRKDGPIFESWIEDLSSSISDFLGNAKGPYGHDKLTENYKRMHETRKRIGDLFLPDDGLRLRRYIGSPEFMRPILEKFHELKKY